MRLLQAFPHGLFLFAASFHQSVSKLFPRRGKEKNKFPGGIFVFLFPPSWEELRNRLMKRGCEEKEAVRERLEKAHEECKEVFWYDYVIINDNLTETVDRLGAIYVAEKSRRERLLGRIDKLLKSR